jgi:hypothetical protein
MILRLDEQTVPQKVYPSLLVHACIGSGSQLINHRASILQ